MVSFLHKKEIVSYIVVNEFLQHGMTTQIKIFITAEMHSASFSGWTNEINLKKTLFGWTQVSLLKSPYHVVLFPQMPPSPSVWMHPGKFLPLLSAVNESHSWDLSHLAMAMLLVHQRALTMGRAETKTPKTAEVNSSFIEWIQYLTC